MCENERLLLHTTQRNNQNNLPTIASGRHIGSIEKSSLLSSTLLLQQDYLPGRCTGTEQSNSACRPSRTSSEIDTTTEERPQTGTVVPAVNNDHQPAIQSDLEFVSPVSEQTPLEASLPIQNIKKRRRRNKKSLPTATTDSSTVTTTSNPNQSNKIPITSRPKTQTPQDHPQRRRHPNPRKTPSTMPARFEDVTAADNRHRGGPGVGIAQNHPGGAQDYATRDPKDDVVITGLSGRLPESSNIGEFRDNLFNGVDMVNDDARRWPKGLYDLPDRVGKIKDADLEQFDLQFFSVHQKQAECMDPQMRILLEITHEAIVDAGFNPQDLRGSRTGVYIGVSTSEVEQYWCADPDRVNGYGLTGCARAMFANRLSFTFDLKGPSFATDTACSSSLYALAQAFEDMRSGRCDSAIVAGSGLILNPTMSLQFKRLGMLGADGTCRAFDKSGAGYVRSDGVVAIFLQKASAARRIYASVLNVRTNTDGSKEQGITYPDGNMQNRLIRETYESIGLDPADVVYVEAHGTGTKAGDPQEVNSIDDFFCKDRKTPLLMGSVKSNMGHSEPASGMCSVAKILIAMEEGVIPANLHFKSPNPDLHGIVEGRIKVVDQNLPWNGGIIGLNSFGFGGANAHVILKSNPKPKQLVKAVEAIPRLVAVSGRTVEAVELLLDAAETHKDDEEFLGLIRDVHSRNIPLHYQRGYTVIGQKDAIREVTELVEENRPIWFVYAGMGSQWSGMARDLMHIEVFSKSIRRSAAALQPLGIDLIDIVTRKDDQLFENILNSFISIAAVQVALTDLLSFVGITPNGIVGHSVGELGCAYADGCFTPEQTVLAAYWRGKSIVETELIPGTMAAVGLTWEQCKEQLPKDVIPACHNSKDSVTISGPSDSVAKVIANLTAQGIFAKAVKSNGIAFHSQYISDAGPKLRKSLDRIIPNPKNRSSRWISSSIPESGWSTPIAQQSSAAYHVNNLLSQVLFHEAVQHVPKNAICIEIAPTGLLQAILKRSLGGGVINLSLLKRDHENNLQFLLQNLGKLHSAGAHPAISKLYRPISYPVGRGTPMLNSKIGWDHSVRFMVPKINAQAQSGETVIEVNLAKEEYGFISGHTIDGRVLFPATGYITLVWRTFAKTKNSTADKVPVILEDLVFHRPTIMPKDGSVKFGINFFDGTGRFELCESGSLTVSGKISVPEDVTLVQLQLDPHTPDTSAKAMNTNDIYKELRLRGYDYTGKFQGIVEADGKADHGKLQWNADWISYMDTMLQFGILGNDIRELYLPVRISKVVIDPVKHLELLAANATLPVNMYKHINVLQSGGVEIRGMKASMAARRGKYHSAPILEKYSFAPNHNFGSAEDTAQSQAVRISVQLAVENSGGALKIKVADVVADKGTENILAQSIQSIIESEPILITDVAICTSVAAEPYVQAVGESGIRVLNKDATKGAVEQNCHLVTAYEVTSHSEAGDILRNLRASIKDTGFILLEENVVGYNEKRAVKLFAEQQLIQISKLQRSNKFLILLRPQIDVAGRNKEFIVVDDNSFDWVEELKESLASAEVEDRYVYIVSTNEQFGALGLMTCIKNETGGKNARLVYVQDKITEKFSFEGKLFKEQLNKDLLVNVYKNGVWGTYRHLPLECQTNEATLQVEHAYVNALTKGDLSSLSWIESPLSRQLPDPSDKNFELCTVYYAPLNFRDVMLSSGKLAADALPGDLATQDCVLGMEFSGRDSTGKRVMALVSAKSLASTCLADTNFLWDVPETWTLEQASTIPCVYATAYYALVIRGNIKKGESILIHAGSGGVGQAAISVALSRGLTVYTTVGSQAKRDFLKKTFPELKDANIGNSRNTTFEQLVMQQTKGRGVDVVLNSLAGEQLLASVRCLGLDGRFLEIGKVDLNNDSPLGMSVFLKNTAFHGILLDSVIDAAPNTAKTIVDLVSDGIRTGAVRPLPTTVFSEKQVEQAFRYMGSGKHTGKVVLKVRDEEPIQKQLPKLKLINAIPRTYMHKEKTYVLVGGLGGFGLELTNWLVSRGATKIVLNSRSGVRSGYQASMVRRWVERGINISIDTNDVTTNAGSEAMLKAANKLGPVGGIFNLAAVLVDNILDQLTPDDFSAVFVPKVTVTKCLDTASRQLCKELDYFICFSSVSCGRGNIGQSNYGLANSAMERLCESRQAAGLPATAIQWGAIGDTGLVLENLGNNETEIGGTLPQRMPSCLQTIDLFLQQPYAVLASTVVAEKRKEASSGESLVKCVANIMGLKDLKNVPDQASLADLGMDSLMGAEIKQTLERNYEVVLSISEIRQMTFGKLKALESGNSDTLPAAEATTESTTLKAVGDGTQVVFSNELLPSKVLIQLPSKVAAGSKRNPIFVVHAIEGFVDALTPLASRLDVPVWGLQCTADAPLESLQGLAVYYVKTIKSVQPVGPYTIAGYSFGAAIAFEMVIEIEKQGDAAQLIMIDGSPKYVNWFTNAQRMRLDQHGKVSVEEEEAMGLAYFALVVANLTYAPIVQALVPLKTFAERIEAVAELVKKETRYPKDLIEQTAQVFFQKLVIADSYRPVSNVKANVLLFKASDTPSKLSADYGLSENCAKVDVVTLTGDHRTILTGDSLDKLTSVLQQLTI